MKKSLLFILFVCLQSVGFAQKKKVLVTYNQEDVHVIVTDNYVGRSPSTLKLDFDLGGDIIFFKKGYFSYRVTLDVDEPFSNLKVVLKKKPKSTNSEDKVVINFDTLAVKKIVTNFTDDDIKEAIDENFGKNGFFIGKSADMFSSSANKAKDAKYKIAIEVIESYQLRRTYKSPKFLLGYIKLRWTLLDVNSNEVVFYTKSDGTYFVPIRSTKNLVIQDQMFKIVKEAIREAQFKLLENKKFLSLVEG